jgi:hypothetical protein
MGFEMRMEQRMILICSACGEDMQGHATDCPQGKLEALWESAVRGRCPTCRKGDVLKNSADYMECRKCRTQFSLSDICGGENPDTLETVMLDLSDGYYGPAKRMKTPGSGDIPVLRKTERLHAEKQATIVARRQAQALYKKVYERTLARELAKIEKKKEGGKAS